MKDRWLATKVDAAKELCDALLTERTSSRATNLLQIMLLENNEEHATRFWRSSIFKEVVNVLPGFTDSTMLSAGAASPNPLFMNMLEFESKKKAKSALKVIMACHHGNAWPPFGVSYMEPSSLKKNMPATAPLAAST